MHLGPDSAIDVFYDGRERRVQLLKGEAFFEVTPDAQRPFRVAARTVETTVLGTAFNVRLGSDDTEVAVRRGLVGVADTSVTPALSERLQPGAWVQVSRDGRAERGAFPPEEIAPWLHGQMIARDRRMADVVDELRRYYDGAIVVAGSGLGGRRVTGVYILPILTLLARSDRRGRSRKRSSSERQGISLASAAQSAQINLRFGGCAGNGFFSVCFNRSRSCQAAAGDPCGD